MQRGSIASRTYEITFNHEYRAARTNYWLAAYLDCLYIATNQTCRG